MRVELLYFDGCPGYRALLPVLRALLSEAGIEEQVELSRIGTIEDAERARFLGSTTVRIDGEDVEPGAAEREDFGLKCRVYPGEAGLARLPPKEWIRAALRAAA